MLILMYIYTSVFCKTSRDYSYSKIYVFLTCTCFYGVVGGVYTYTYVHLYIRVL